MNIPVVVINTHYRYLVEFSIMHARNHAHIASTVLCQSVRLAAVVIVVVIVVVV